MNDCEHLETDEIVELPGIIMCAECGALFDVYDPDNIPALTKPLTAEELNIILVAAKGRRAYAA